MLVYSIFLENPVCLTFFIIILLAMFQIHRYLKHYARLSLRQKWDFCRVLYRLSLMVVQIKFRSIDWFWVKKGGSDVIISENQINSEKRQANVQVANELHETIRLASRLLPFSCECVPRSLVLRDMLQKKGVVATVYIGVNKVDANLQSHAWVEVYGDAIGENSDVKSLFKPIDSNNGI